MFSRSLLAIPLFATPILAPLLVTLFGASAIAQTTPPAPAPATGKDASIPFVRLGGIYNFQADGDRGVYLQDRSRKWYYATVWAPCTELPFATRIGVKTQGIDTLDKFGSILVDGHECKIGTLVTSGPPPKKAKKAKQPSAGT